ncbi:phage tail tube protein [Streptomyces chiangmaiensis]|uniref:Phage tail protein n=1 Tax=Streptomyces chiangmaiensis TaxID=766497 RepID=A0ABU7FHX3_9ACTN|nr:phage tail protein [Streptomyces chiangmaiensis]MED7822963.1 phage tail protein [Streptomyces chiangmaiensis]
MAGFKNSEVRIAGTGNVWVAPAGTAAPKETTALATPWVNLGFTSSDGVKFNKKDKNDPVDTWQSMAPARFMLSDRDLTVKFQLLQMNKDTFPFYLGLASTSIVTAGSTAETTAQKIDITGAPGGQDQRALAIDFADNNGTKDLRYRLVIPNGAVSEVEELSLTRTGAVKLGITFTALSGDTPTNPLATWLVNDPAALA